MRSYCRLKITLAGFFLIYLVLAFSGLLTQNKEIFPFYTWFLFAAVPNAGNHYEVVILKNKGQSFTPPIPYAQAANIAIFPQAITAYQFIQKMGRSHDKGDSTEFTELARLFQRDFLIGPTTYQLLRIYYDPIERWHGKESQPVVLQTIETTPATP
jgi:hypothetical protein